jgi:small GTP-binding protein
MTSPETSALAKVLVVGAADVGKTSLVNRLVFRDFVDVSPTVGVNLAHKVCTGHGGPLKLSIWDLSGHPRFSTLMPRFCSGASGVVVVVDLSDPASLEEAASWLKLIQTNTDPEEPYVVVLAGNKTDLPRRVSDDAIDQFCAAHDVAAYVACSAKSGENVPLAFRTLCTTLQDRLPEFTEHAGIPSPSPG